MPETEAAVPEPEQAAGSAEAPAAEPSEASFPETPETPEETVPDNEPPARPEEPAREPAPAEADDNSRSPIPETRDLEKYPIFSENYPERRLNVPGDPEAWAEFAGK